MGAGQANNVHPIWAWAHLLIGREIDYDKIDKLRGLDIAITTTAKTDEEGKALLEAFNFPFKKK